MQERRVIAYGSRQLRTHEDKYPTHDLELAAVIYALKLWRHYLLGNHCEVYTDHQSLKYLFTQPDLNLHQQRWLETIADFNMDISYTPGKANVMVDALSRKSYCNALEVQIQQPLLYEEFQKLNLKIVPQGHVNSLVIEPDLVKAVKIMQGYDDFVHKIKRDIKNGKPTPFTLDDECVACYKGRLVVTHSKGRQGNLNQTLHVMKEAHDTPLSIHPGSTKMYQDIRQRYWWPGMKQDIARYVDECDVCRRIKAEDQRPAGTLQPLSIPKWKWDKIEMDFVTGFPRSQKGHDAIFVIIDRFSKVAHFLPVKETISYSQLADLYVSRIVSLHGVPLEISSDHGSIFTSNFWDSFQEAMGTHLKFSTAYHP